MTNVKIKRTGAAEYNQYMKLLICGPAGSGKTLISSTAPNPIYASAEGGLMSIADRGIPYAEIKASDHLVAFKNSLDQAPDVRKQMFGFPIDTVVVDTIDEIQHVLIAERMKETKKDTLELRDWGWLGEQMQAIIRGFRNLEANVIFLAHLKESSDGDSGRVWMKPGLQGQIADQIANFVDLSLLLKATTTTRIVDGQAQQVTSRVLVTAADPLYPWIKDRSGKLPPEIELNFQDDLIRVQQMIYGAVADSSAVAEMPPIVMGDPNEVSESEPVAESEPEQETNSEVEAVPEAAPEVAVKSPAPLPKRQTLATVESADTAKLPLAPEGVLCEECEKPVETSDQADLSRIRFRKILCKVCYGEKKGVRV